ncbi:cupin [Roseovarius sp. TE539]|uniref:cupin domain-containing protein n=1 Tax=Roseovarius sp. TE539 TaxID=2249812 RepID=UPI000DDEC138|nr:cupin domain-containing protein [Roseovarius sp. TE539]RBI69969.1 cupin [Roseovarius sp. TE539]
MHLNADFSQRAVVRFAEGDWVASPMPGVRRRMLDRIGDEVARATSIVRFDPGSAFPPHTHDGGEEYLVLDGIFQDENGDFPAGSYVRNPPTSSHTPAAREGATILVKLHQFDPDDRTQVRVDSGRATWVQAAPGVNSLLLHEDGRERVVMEHWAPGTARNLDATGGLEVFVIAGGLSEGTETFGPWDWLRLPVGSAFDAEASPEGARVWIKTGHLRHTGKAPA